MVVCHRPRGLVVAACRRRQRCRPTQPSPAVVLAEAVQLAIICEVARVFRVAEQDILSPSRRADLVAARQYCYQLAYEQGAGESAIGRAFRRDHATIRHALTRFERRSDGDAAELALFRQCRRGVRRRLAAEGQQGGRP